jgi:hypothetical protein
MNEVYLFISYLTLLAIGYLSLLMSIILHLKAHAMNKLPENLTPNTFNKTFTVFDPFPRQRKTIHNLLVLPLAVFLANLFFILILLKTFEVGLLLPFFLFQMGLNLMMVEDALEAYKWSKNLANAIKIGTSLGVGDLKALNATKKLLPKLSNYYLGLAIFFITSAVVLPYIMPSVILLLAQFASLILQIGASVGFINWLVVTLLFALISVLFQIFISHVKKKLLMQITEFQI